MTTGHINVNVAASSSNNVTQDNGPSLFARVGSALFYALASILVVFINKIILTNWKFPSFMFIAFGQMLATIGILFIGKLFKIVHYPDLSRDTLRKIFPLPALYLLNLVTGLGGTQKLNLPMFTVMRRFSILMTMIGEFLLLGVRSKRAVQIAVGLMIFGAIVAASDDLTFDVYGYGLVLLNDFFTAANGVVMKRKLNAKELGENGLLFYNSLLMLPFILLLCYCTGDFEQVIKYSDWSKVVFIVGFFIACVCGFILNYSIVLCTHLNSPLTTACVGPVKNMFVTYVGMFSSGDYLYSLRNFVGINISVFGSLVYSYATFSRGSAQKNVIVTKTPKEIISPRP